MAGEDGSDNVFIIADIDPRLLEEEVELLVEEIGGCYVTAVGFPDDRIVMNSTDIPQVD